MGEGERERVREWERERVRGKEDRIRVGEGRRGRRERIERTKQGGIKIVVIASSSTLSTFLSPPTLHSISPPPFPLATLPDPTFHFKL